MKILFVLHPSFLDNSENLRWINNLRIELSRVGLQVDLSEFASHKISDYPIIHLFGFGYFDLFFQLKNKGVRTICTPSITNCESETKIKSILRKFLIFIHMIKQRSLRPLDVFSMIRSFDKYVFSNSTSSSWRKRWNLHSDRLHEFNFQDKEFPDSLKKFYEEIEH